MNREREAFLQSLQTFDEGDLGEIAQSVRQNASLVDTAAGRAGDIFVKYIDPLLPKKKEEEDDKKKKKAPSSLALYGILAVGVVGAGLVIYAVWPKKAKKSE
jgi:hypothetical protein